MTTSKITIAGVVPEICPLTDRSFAIKSGHHRLSANAVWRHWAFDCATFPAREAAEQFIIAHADPPASAEAVEAHKPLFVAAPEEVQRCALFAADVFSEEVDMISETEKIDLANKILQRWVDNTPAYPPSPVRGNGKMA